MDHTRSPNMGSRTLILRYIESQQYAALAKAGLILCNIGPFMVNFQHRVRDDHK